MRRDNDDLIERVAAELRRPAALPFGFEARVMAEVRSARRPSAWARAWEWVREPRMVALSPLGGLAMAAAIAGVVTLGALAWPTPVATPGASTAPAESAQAVQFVLHAPQARAVFLAGDFNGWDARQSPLARAPSGLWFVELLLPPGRYTYAFVVDGSRFVPDPAAPRAVGEDFGTPSSVVIVGSANQAGGRSL